MVVIFVDEEGEQVDEGSEGVKESKKRKVDRLFSAGLNGYIVEWDLVRYYCHESLSSSSLLTLKH